MDKCEIENLVSVPQRKLNTRPPVDQLTIDIPFEQHMENVLQGGDIGHRDKTIELLTDHKDSNIIHS